MKKLFVSAIVGALLGIIGSKYWLVGSALSLIPWSIVGVVLGLWCTSKLESVKNGVAYGFFLVFVFMIAGYTGSASTISRVPFFAMLGIFGALCGVLLVLMGMYLKRFKKQS